MEELLKRIADLGITTPLREKKGLFVVDEDLGTGLLFAALFKEKPANCALIASNQYSAQRLYEFLLNFLEEKDVVFFPSDELLRAQSLASSRELLSQRLYALGQLTSPGKKILVTHPSALLRYLPDPKRFLEETLEFKVGKEFDLKDLKSRLVDLGYEAVNRVERTLQFASRGDILDIFSVSYLDPIRIEFFGDEIESIRLFDLRSQESKATLTSVSVLPATDIFLNDDELCEFMSRAKKEIERDSGLLGESIGVLLKQYVGADLEKFIAHDYRGDLYRYYGFALGKSYSVLDYVKADIVFVCNGDRFKESVAQLETEAHQYLSELNYKGRSLSRLEQYIDVDDVFTGKGKVIYSSPFSSKPDSHIFLPHAISSLGKNISAVGPTIQSYLATNEKVVVCVLEPQQRKTLLGILDELKIEYEETKGLEFPKGKLGISSFPLNHGFEISEFKTAFISAHDLFGRRGAASRFTSRFKEATVLHSYEDLKPGDYVVHEYNGIGQFLDIKTILVEGVHRDFLHIAYAGNEFLYVPLEQFRLVRKYAGREGATPKLSRLSSGEWTKRKAAIQKKVDELAERLIALYGSRAKLPGFAFPPDDELQVQFENEFPHELTPDQQTALNEIKADMEKPGIMDRLLCGDVGFGKTEVAFRAAFKAINSGKQVALLCPTTLLARQHYELALQRFSTFGVRIAVFSRLVAHQRQKKNLEDLAKGNIDLVIGTHKLLSKLVSFKDLGLLIVDEEQRFGVAQKESIKELKKTVDVLTLSATPIPRTLQMSLVGIRPLSQINTAPTLRMPIQTYVIPFKEDVVDELIQRELSRHGQVFYIHNKVQSIYAVASKMASRIKGAEVGVVHGQMEKEQIEDVMERFYDGDIDVLVCTSIVENGIDIPNANLIVVENADQFGLAQLYQIKGRVGRGDRIAYAYLTYNQHKNMNEDGEKRLRAIQEFTELGSGYKIAQRDLMIRGAGDILGAEQAGFIDSVGLDLYLKMLNQAFEAKQKGEVIEPPVPKKMFGIDAYIPGEFASDSDKLDLYHELEDIKDNEGLESYRKKVRDIYGRLPNEFELLLQKKRIDLLIDEEEFESIEELEKVVDVLLSSSFTKMDGIGTDLFAALAPYLGVLTVTFLNKQLKFRIKKSEHWLDDLEKILTLTHKVYQKRRGDN